MDEYRVTRVRSSSELEDIYRLRVAAWRARSRHFPALERWADEYDEGADHWGVRYNGQIVAAGRVTIHDSLSGCPDADLFAGFLPADTRGPIAALGRLVVHPDHAGKGLSAILDELRVNYAAEAQCRVVIGSTVAGPARISSARALGFEILGETPGYYEWPLNIVSEAGKHPVAFALRLDHRG